MAAAQSVTRSEARQKRIEGANEGNTQGEKMLTTISFRSVRRGRKVYRYPRVNIPAEIAEKLGLHDAVEAEVWVEQRNGEKVIVIRPLVKR